MKSVYDLLVTHHSSMSALGGSFPFGHSQVGSHHKHHLSGTVNHSEWKLTLITRICQVK